MIGTIVNRSGPHQVLVPLVYPPPVTMLLEAGDPRPQATVEDFVLSVDTLLRSDDEIGTSTPVTVTLRLPSAGDPVETKIGPFIGRRYLVFAVRESSTGKRLVAGPVYAPQWITSGMIDMEDPERRVRYAHGELAPYAESMDLAGFQAAIEREIARP
jgi:hypothetical protein